MRLGAAALLIVAFFVVMQVFVLPPDGFMTGDQGSKYLQTRAFADRGPLNPGIDVRSRDIDPDYRHQEPKLKNRRGRLVSEFMWLMPLAGAPFLALLGMRGLYVVPALSALVVFFCAARLGRCREDPDGVVTGVLVLLVTPVAVYGLELWEHAPATACVMIAAVLFAADRPSRGRLFAAGAAAIVAFLFREEAAVMLPALLLGRAAARDRDRLRDLLNAAFWSGLGALVMLIASMPMNLIMYGAMLPMHLTQDAWEYAKSVSYLTVRHEIVTMLFMPAEYSLVYGLALISGIVAAIYASARRTSRGALVTIHAAVFVMLALGVALPLWHLARGANQFESYRVTSAAHTWAFALALLYLPWLGAPGRRRVARYLIVSGVLGVLFTSLVIPGTAGSQWSPRFYLQVTPLLAIPAVDLLGWRSEGGGWRVEDGGWRVETAVRATLIASFVMLVCGVAYLGTAKNRFANVTHGLARLTAPGEVVISDVFWLPEVTATLAPTRRMLFSWNSMDTPELASLAVKRGLERFTLVTYAALTHHTAPDSYDVPGAKCVYVRGEHQFGLEIRGLVLSRYSCASP